MLVNTLTNEPYCKALFSAIYPISVVI